jgi:hypothetical protein
VAVPETSMLNVPASGNDRLYEDALSTLAANQLLERARQRLAEELREWPPLESPLLWVRLSARTALPPSPGVLVHFIRGARSLEKYHLARELFVRLLEEIELSCARWAAQCVARTPSVPHGERELLREDLRQELALHLWDQVGLRTKPGWELFFQRSLAFAEQHTATSLMQQRGYWRAVGVARPQRASMRLLRHIDVEALADRQPVEDGAPHFSGAELSDLRTLVEQLPERLRLAIVLRYWQDASEADISRALGGVTPRTVRNYLRQAYTLLRDWYGECAVGSR